MHLKRLLTCAGMVSLVFLASCQDDVTRPASDSSASPSFSAQGAQGEVIVLFDRSLDDARGAAEGLARSHGFELDHVYGTAVKGFSAPIPDRAIAAIQNDPRVVSVEPVEAFTFAAQDLPTGIDRIETDKNPNADIDSTDDVRVGFDVAIIDSGIDGDHPDLNVAGGINFANGGADNWDDGSGHGSHVAGTVGAVDNGAGVVGVAPGTPLWAVRVCGNSGFCFTDDMVAGIDWVAERKATGDIDFASANMSITTSDDAEQCTGSSGAVHEAICGLVNEGVVFSLAAGNDDRVKEAFPEVTAVSALADFDGKGGGVGSPTCRSDEDESLANFSNYGSTVDVAAPGVCILSTWKDGGYNTISGTSMAAPHFAGSVALYLHANGLSPAQSATGVDDIEAAILGDALPEGTANHECSYDNEKGSTEPMLFVNGAAFGGDGSCDTATTSTDDPPTVSWHNPTDGETVNGTVTIQIDASDAEDDTGSLTVEWAVDGGTFQTATYNSSTGFYEDSWDTTAESDGDHTLDARATDSSGNTSSASISVTVDNTADGGSGDMYVWDIGFRTTGPHLRSTVTIQQDSDGDGAAESSDDPVADASVAMTLTHDTDGDGVFECGTDDDCQSFTGTTDTSGQVEFMWKQAPSGTYQAEVTDLTHSSLTWDATLDADNPDTFTLQ